MRQTEPTVYNFCVACGQQLQPRDSMCSCCGTETVEVNRVSLPKNSTDRWLARDDSGEPEDPFYLL